MSGIEKRITSELQVLLGQPFTDCWRIGNMQVFEFGPGKKYLNRKGEEVVGGDLKLHVACRWRMVDGTQIIFGRDDMSYPENEAIPIEDFDWNKDESVLDVALRTWFDNHRANPVKVVQVSGDVYGGCRIDFEDRLTLELFPCGSNRDDYSEHWRFFGHRPDDYHFVVTGSGIQGDAHSG